MQKENEFKQCLEIITKGSPIYIRKIDESKEQVAHYEPHQYTQKDEIDLVINQSGFSKRIVKEAFRKNNGDMIAAIFEIEDDW